MSSISQRSLAEELMTAESGFDSSASSPDQDFTSLTNPALMLKNTYLHDENESSDVKGFSMHDADSGNSTQPSPENSLNFISSSARAARLPRIDLLDATHRGLYRFVPRHSDELEIDIGDPIYVQKEADDLWCEGVNLRTGKQGIFPVAHVTDVEYSDFDPTVLKSKKERYLLSYLGSVETLSHKGNQVLCQAVRKIASGKTAAARTSVSCILEISDLGIRMLNKSKPTDPPGPCHDYFYHLKHVSFCGFHPKNPRYFGFITKHPSVPKFACHVFESEESTRPVAEAFGRAYQRFYKTYIETVFPVEDIYLE